MRARRAGLQKQIARERIDILLKQAQSTVTSSPGLSRRCMELARAISLKSGVRLTREEKLFTCKGCWTLLVPGVNCRVRIRPEEGTMVIVTCLSCGAKKRYPAVKEKRSVGRTVRRRVEPTQNSWSPCC